jgi:hypothetical protein
MDVGKEIQKERKALIAAISERAAIACDAGGLRDSAVMTQVAAFSERAGAVAVASDAGDESLALALAKVAEERLAILGVELHNTGATAAVTRYAETMSAVELNTGATAATRYTETMNALVAFEGVQQHTTTDDHQYMSRLHEIDATANVVDVVDVWSGAAERAAAFGFQKSTLSEEVVESGEDEGVLYVHNNVTTTTTVPQPLQRQEFGGASYTAAQRVENASAVLLRARRAMDAFLTSDEETALHALQSSGRGGDLATGAEEEEVQQNDSVCDADSRDESLMSYRRRFQDATTERDCTEEEEEEEPTRAAAPVFAKRAASPSPSKMEHPTAKTVPSPAIVSGAAAVVKDNQHLDTVVSALEDDLEEALGGGHGFQHDATAASLSLAVAAARVQVHAASLTADLDDPSESDGTGGAVRV